MLVLFMPVFAYAESGLYSIAGVGAVTVRGLKPSSIEQQIMNTPGVASSENITDKSTFKLLGVGHCFNRYVCLEGAYIWDIHLSTNLAVKNPNTGIVVVNGTLVNLNSLPSTITFRREADVSATQLSVLGKIPVTDWADILCRVGAYQYRMKATAKLFLPQNIFLAEEFNETGTVPMASLGVDIRYVKKAALRIEGLKIGRVSLGSVLLTYDF